MTAVVTYAAAHVRVKTRRGRPEAHTCAWCAEVSGQEWALVPGRGNELVGIACRRNGFEYEAAYSPDPDDYVAMCRPCHREFDRQARRYR